MVCALFICSIANAAAPTVKIVGLKYDDGRVAPAEIYIDGEITRDIAERFNSALAAHGVERGTVYLNSNGGDLNAGMELGGIIRRKGLNTAIGRMGAGYGKSNIGSCQSSCVMTFAGGVYRFSEPTSYFGIHRFFSRTAGSRDLDLGQVLSAAMTSYLIRMGVSPSLFERMVLAGSSMQKLSVQDAVKLGLVNNGVLPARWQIVGKGGKVYLEGEQDTWNGAGRIQLHCKPGSKLTLTAQYDAEHNTQRILQEARNYSIRVNDRFIAIDPATLQRKPRVEQGYITVEVSMSYAMTDELKNAHTIGFAIHPAHATIFYGFEIPANSHADIVQSYIKHCFQ